MTEQEHIAVLLDANARLKGQLAALLTERDAPKADTEAYGRQMTVLMNDAVKVVDENHALKAQLEDERVWRRDAERAAAGGQCSCWLGRVGATSGSSLERQACAVHGDEAEVSECP